MGANVLHIDQAQVSCGPLSQIEAPILPVVTDDRAVTGSRNIRHSRNIPSIVCGACCDCCGFFRSTGKVALPSLLEVAPVKTFRRLIAYPDRARADFEI